MRTRNIIGMLATTLTAKLIVTGVFCAAGSSGLMATEPVSMESLLIEMVGRDSVAKFPETDFRLKQESSYNRASKSPGEAKGWFNNKDNNTSKKDKNFLRTEENSGRKEWVLMDDKGAGAIVRTWMPWKGQTKPNTNSIIRFYIDGKPEPALEGNMFELFQGKGLVPFPLAHESLRSAVSFFPITYAKSCKVTVSELPFFYQITYRDYPDGTPVRSFTADEFGSLDGLIKETCKALLSPKVEASGAESALETVLKPGEEKGLDLPDGGAAIRDLSVKLDSYVDPSVTRSVVLKAEFDGKPTIWCPIGDFFGSGVGLHPFQGWYRTVKEDGTMSSRWVMPYREKGRVSVVNLGETEVNLELKVTTGTWKWDERSMYFNAAWRGQYPVPTRPYSDWNYVTLKGRGVYVGDTLTVMNPIARWWGEGDEKIFVDGEKFPSIFGTGTEDYYAYSWGGVSTDFYEHPFHAQPRSNVYNKLNRKKTKEKNTQGFSTETRTRALDSMPFGSSLQLDMEVWHWESCDMGYDVGVYWYGDSDTTSNRMPDPEGVVILPPVPELK